MYFHAGGWTVDDEEPLNVPLPGRRLPGAEGCALHIFLGCFTSACDCSFCTQTPGLAGH